MRLPERQRGLDAVLQSSQALWHPQPFREIRPQWAIEQPALTTELLALDDDAVEKLIDADPNDSARILALQTDIKVAKQSIVYLTDAISTGDNAMRALHDES